MPEKTLSSGMPGRMKPDPNGQPIFHLRAMTYNIHSCVGTDNHVSLERIARVIGDAAPDVVALQEVDSGLPRSRHQDQAARLAEMLDMRPFFFPVVTCGSQKYGLAVLTRLKCGDVHSVRLPIGFPRFKLNTEKRGCMRLTLQTPQGPVLFFNTHLSLYRLERRRQIRALLENELPTALPSEAAVIFCGDFNAGRFSPVYQQLSRRLSDVQRRLKDYGGPRATFPSRRPLFCLDHMFVSSQLEVLKVQVLRTVDTRTASDHLPLSADLALKPRAAGKDITAVR